MLGIPLISTGNDEQDAMNYVAAALRRVSCATADIAREVGGPHATTGNDLLLLEAQIKGLRGMVVDLSRMKNVNGA